MGQDITLTASDGHELGACRADPEGGADRGPRGGIVVIQEIFGVNVHIRDLCDRFAKLGYLSIAPALYDRFERDFQVGYTPEEIAKGRELKAMGNDGFDNVILDVEAARQVAAEAGRVGITGFCFGLPLGFPGRQLLLRRRHPAPCGTSRHHNPGPPAGALSGAGD